MEVLLNCLGQDTHNSVARYSEQGDEYFCSIKQNIS
jgi:hypothetical protein